MFGLTIEKLVVIAVIAAFIIGPERLPLYAGRVAGFVRGLRDLADSAKLRVKEELGDEYDTVEWTKLDPRQYDPRRIVREALSDSAPRETAGAPAFEPGEASRASASGGAARVSASGEASRVSASGETARVSASGGPAPAFGPALVTASDTAAPSSEPGQASPVSAPRPRPRVNSAGRSVG
jgi:sec-independent protein translocase protein TatB